jgi:hypothetical protein
MGKTKKKVETPKPFMVRLYKKHRRAIKNAAKIGKCSEAEIVRSAVEIALGL